MISRLVLPQEVLELVEHLLNRIEIRAVGRKEQKMGTCGSDRRAHRFGLVATQIVHDDDVAAAERGDQLRFDIDPNDLLQLRPTQKLHSSHGVTLVCRYGVGLDAC